MKIVSYNIRGLGGRIKKKEIRELIRKFNSSVVFLQETKYINHNNVLIHSIWGNTNVEWRAKDAQGLAGEYGSLG